MKENRLPVALVGRRGRRVASVVEGGSDGFALSSELQWAKVRGAVHWRRAVVLRWWCAGVGDTKDGGSAHSVRISSPFPPISMSGSPKKGDEELSLEASRTPPIGAHFISYAPNTFPFSLLFSFKGHAWYRPS
ncbi:hypothetical protein U1Q18_007626 [Sarracenia purpurea var. burkii]